MRAHLKTIASYTKKRLAQDLRSEEERRQKRLFETIESMELGSSRISTWSLSIIGGSMIVFMNEEYIQPDIQNFKYTYFLFLIGWVLLGLSIYYSKRITGRKMAATSKINNTGALKTIFLKVNAYLSNQFVYFNWALVIFALWLILYFVCRIFSQELKCLL